MADQLEQLKGKYATALRVLEQVGIRLQNLHVQDNKLFVRGEAPSQEAKNKFWNQVKLIDPSYADLTADITVSAAAQAASKAEARQGGSQDHNLHGSERRHPFEDFQASLW